jgi:hypothetical protein
LPDGFLTVLAGFVAIRFHSTALPSTPPKTARAFLTAASPTPSLRRSALKLWISSGPAANVDSDCDPSRARMWLFHIERLTAIVTGDNSTLA